MKRLGLVEHAVWMGEKRVQNFGWGNHFECGNWKFEGDGDKSLLKWIAWCESVSQIGCVRIVHRIHIFIRSRVPLSDCTWSR
jgi:hypothetical protein